MSEAEETSPRIGGLLIIPAIALVIAPIRLSLALIGTYMPIFVSAQWDQVPKPVADLFRLEAIGLAVLLPISILTAVQFFQKTRRAPLILSGWLIGVLIFCIADLFMSTRVASLIGNEAVSQAGANVAGAGVGAAVWLTYLAVSNRVKRTFLPAA